MRALRSRRARSLLTLSLLSLLAVACTLSEAGATTRSGGSLLLPAGTLARTTPEPPNVDVIPCDALDGIVLAPDQPRPIGIALVEIVVRNASNDPIPNAIVTTELVPPNVICSGALLSGTTDENGRVFITMAGGGCAHQIALAGIIKANGVTIRAYENVKSPDANGDSRVDLGDLVAFSGEFLGTTGGQCHDYDNDGATSLADLVPFAEAFVAQSRCP